MCAAAPQVDALRQDLGAATAAMAQLSETLGEMGVGAAIAGEPMLLASEVRIKGAADGRRTHFEDEVAGGVSGDGDAAGGADAGDVGGRAAWPPPQPPASLKPSRQLTGLGGFGAACSGDV